MRFYRIKKLSKNEYMPQTKSWMFGKWRSIDIFNRILWSGTANEYYWCCERTKADAKKVIEEFKKLRKKNLNDFN